MPDRTSAPWFRDAWDKADLALFTPKLKFYRPDGSQGKAPANGTALFAAGPRAVDALKRAAKMRLGILAAPVTTEEISEIEVRRLTVAHLIREHMREQGFEATGMGDQAMLAIVKAFEDQGYRPRSPVSI
ncbi:hypothetical protein QTL95_01490 [Rhizobium sp. S152]|uniref:hypothetical protein n=1 Tax=Rhizobium sp. S152 TaxID=3055038 RepID=UPI0025A9D8AB|nr:hypothetical protein [Rhizobium sp. S152]MDM9624550.1 hypothetical protein [Rhizobium sp. S152]